VYADPPMAVFNTENIGAAVWIALKRLDLNGWSGFYNNLKCS